MNLLLPEIQEKQVTAIHLFSFYLLLLFKECLSQLIRYLENGNGLDLKEELRGYTY